MEKVYILGAGSSAVANAPLIRDFKKHVEKIVRGDTQGAYPKLSHALDLWNRTAPEANVEEFYILADLLSRLGTDDWSQKAVEEVTYLIAKTLEVAMGRKMSDIHQKFVHKVWDISQGRGDFAVVTLNWDIALDNASYTHSQFSPAFGYDKARPLDPEPKRRGRFRILKLHGSLNWWLCQKGTCQILWYRLEEKDVTLFWEQGEGKQCRECGGDLLPLMVPPTSQKFEHSRMESSPLRQIWKEAHECLRACQELAIIGYSFPPTDIQFKMFLLEALSRNEELRKVVVVSNRKFGSRRQRFEDGYDDIFARSPHRQKLHFVDKTFEGWVESGMPFEV